MASINGGETTAFKLHQRQRRTDGCGVDVLACSDAVGLGPRRLRSGGVAALGGRSRRPGRGALVAGAQGLRVQGLGVGVARALESWTPSGCASVVAGKREEREWRRVGERSREGEGVQGAAMARGGRRQGATATTRARRPL